MNWTQQDAPLMDALKEHLMNRVVRFDVPGHKGGRGNHELADFLGQRCVQIDVNSMKNLDNLCHPVPCSAMHSSLLRKRSGLPMPFLSSTVLPVLRKL